MLLDNDSDCLISSDESLHQDVTIVSGIFISVSSRQVGLIRCFTHLIKNEYDHPPKTLPKLGLWLVHVFYLHSAPSLCLLLALLSLVPPPAPTGPDALLRTAFSFSWSSLERKRMHTWVIRFRPTEAYPCRHDDYGELWFSRGLANHC